MVICLRFRVLGLRFEGWVFKVKVLGFLIYKNLEINFRVKIKIKEHGLRLVMKLF
jgi:hypothetical protein